jgi:hypothetical protein
VRGVTLVELQTLFLAYAAADRDFAGRLTTFLEFGSAVTCATDEGIAPGGDLIAKAEEGLGSSVLVLVLSPASCPSRWPRARWEPVLMEQAREAGVELVSLLLESCPFPELLRRRNFIDATEDRLGAMRLLKRWLWRKQWSGRFSADLEDLYQSLADRAGTREVSGALATRFVAEAGLDFEATFWIPCYGRSLAQVAGELGSQLGLTLDGTAEQNCKRIRNLLFDRRCLVVLDAPAPEAVRRLARLGRSSTIITEEPVKLLEPADSAALARALVAQRRYAEAYEMLYRLVEAGVETDACARELAWICERWDRLEEANHFRQMYSRDTAEQMGLF